MKVVLLAGGFGSRISEESQFKPKPMIEIGGMPIMVIPSLLYVQAICKNISKNGFQTISCTTLTLPLIIVMAKMR